tara:strand:+ start:65 stop:1723 length:1659 start_codon:yes stop_codon:yes gene_type:complete
MRKKRILFCSEATFLNTGYATYTREIMNYLQSTDKYELGELASYTYKGHPYGETCPWKFYGVQPHPEAPKEEQEHYKSNPTYQFGEYRFEEVCLDFKPDVVCDIRDFWMMDFVDRSPFRNFFKWCIMPTVDAAPQGRQWIETYASADACLSYSDWSGEVLKNQSGGKINYLGSSPPSAHPAYKPADNAAAFRQSIGLPADLNIIGTVMRNQRRKLYPDLFECFRNLLDSVDNPDDYALYCHTSYPDMGWEIPELLQQHSLSSKVLFTYFCQDTRKPFPSYFRGAVTTSPYTGKNNALLCSVRNGLSYEDLSSIMSTFDLYVQYANSEGFGLPQVEAAACGVPVMSIDYSAMSSVVRQLDGVPLPVKALYKELETGCYRAVPDNKASAELIKEFFNLPSSMRKIKGNEARRKFLQEFQWDKSGKMWEDYFDSFEISDEKDTWLSSLRIVQPEPMNEQVKQMDAHSQAQWLISRVLCDADRLNTFMESRLTRDLLYKCSTSVTGGMYFNESSAQFDSKNIRAEFDLEKGYDHMVNLANRHNHFEQMRGKAFNIT